MAAKPSWLLVSPSSVLFPHPLPQINVLPGAEYPILIIMTFSGKPICFCNLTFTCRGLPVPQLRPEILNMWWTPDLQPEHHPGTGWECKYSGPISDLWNQTLWGCSPVRCV